MTEPVKCSPFTEHKQRDFRIILSTHIKIVKSIFYKRPTLRHKVFLYVDMNAGSGNYSCEGKHIDGSPIIFLKEVLKQGINYEVILYEKDTANFINLKSRINHIQNVNMNNISIFNKDNKEIINDVNSKEILYGLVYHDSNGLSDFDTISKLFKGGNLHKTDIMIYCMCGPDKRALKSPICSNHTKNLIEKLLEIQKEHWIIREPEGSYQFTFLIGTNWKDFPKFKKQGFHLALSKDSKIPIDPKAREILMRITLTREEVEEWKKTHGN